MENFTLHLLSKEVKSLLAKLQTTKDTIEPNLAIEFKNLYVEGKITKQDYLFLYTRMLLTEFCLDIEATVGNGVRTGFCFYCEDEGRLFFGAGPHFPPAMKEFYKQQTFLFLPMTSEDYEKNVYCIQDISERKNSWSRLYRHMKADGIQSVMRIRLNYKDFSFGVFELYYPMVNGPKTADEPYLRQKIIDIKKELYHMRQEMLDTIKCLEEANSK